MNFGLSQIQREELIFTPYDSTRDIIEVNGVRQDVPGLFRVGLWMVMVEVAIKNKHIPCVGVGTEFERLVAHLEHYEVERQDRHIIYRLTF